ncbi:MAG: 5-demethoxyubiquinol-8 5-hydroxylase UbiM [Pseudomonadota bacterium]|nr:5-demethoxyubiquinol-8 5-hydroxylase UbiM [Pseudomonadota bacterium]
MQEMNAEKNYDVIIVGAGPAGLSFACSLINLNLQVMVVERSPLSSISSPKPDGRETALTHNSLKILQRLGVWDLIDQTKVSPLREAKVFDGDSDSLLNFAAKKSSIDALGYLVPNHLIRLALYQKASLSDSLSIICDLSVETVETNYSGGKVTLSDGQILNSKLIVAADSRFSEIRRKMGIESTMKDFSKVMIVTRVSHEKDHNQVALECFNYGHTLALLPLNGNISSVVLTVPTDEADEMFNMDNEKFCKFASDGFNGSLGKMKQIGERFSYPLVGVYAQKFRSTRFALIGDAAVGMHPVTAHGFNLGLRGQDILSKSISKALNAGKDIGSVEVLREFENKQIHLSRLMYFGTNGVVSLFTNDDEKAKQIRKLVLKFADRFPPIKSLITKHLTESKKSNLIPF